MESTELSAKGIEAFKATVTDDLQVAVDRFNKDLAAWEARAKCKANFRWSYSQDGAKKMLIQDISLPVYREETPEGFIDKVVTTMQETQPEQVKPA